MVQRQSEADIAACLALVQGAADSDGDAAKPLTVALGVATDVARQLPFTVLVGCPVLLLSVYRCR